MLIRGSKLISAEVVFDFDAGVVQNISDDGTLETNEDLSLLVSQSNGVVNSPTNPNSTYNPANFTDTSSGDNGSDPSSTTYYYPRVSPETNLDWEPGVDPNSDGNTGNNNGDPDPQNYFNPESETDVPLVLGQDQPEEMIKGQTWLTFDENGRGVISVFNGEEWSQVGEEYRPLDIGSY